MPWTGKSFAKHNKGLGKAGSAKAAKVANAVLRESGDEGKAIRIANWQAAGRPGRQGGGHVDPRGGGRGIVPYARGGRMGDPRKGDGAYLVGEKGPEIFVPRHRGAIVPNHELKKLGDKYAKRRPEQSEARARQRGGPVEASPDTPQAGFRPAGRQEENLVRRGLISNKAKEKRLAKYSRGAKHGYSKGETETTPIDASTR